MTVKSTERIITTVQFIYACTRTTSGEKTQQETRVVRLMKIWAWFGAQREKVLCIFMLRCYEVIDYVGGSFLLTWFSRIIPNRCGTQCIPRGNQQFMPCIVTEGCKPFPRSASLTSLFPGMIIYDMRLAVYAVCMTGIQAGQSLIKYSHLLLRHLSILQKMSINTSIQCVLYSLSSYNHTTVHYIDQLAYLCNHHPPWGHHEKCRLCDHMLCLCYSNPPCIPLLSIQLHSFELKNAVKNGKYRGNTRFFWNICNKCLKL